MKLDDLVEVKELFAIFDLATPEGRWNALQEFLRKNKKWKQREKDFLEAVPEDAPRIVCEWIDISPSLIPFLDKGGELRRQAINGFRIAQEMYKERKGVK